MKRKILLGVTNHLLHLDMVLVLLVFLVILPLCLVSYVLHSLELSNHLFLL